MNLWSFVAYTFQPAFGRKAEKHVFASICLIILAVFSIFPFLNAKKVKKLISTAVWHAQNTNAGQNIQHKYGRYSKYAFVHVFE